MEAGSKSAEPRHYDYIDALRGWAFLGVVLVHVGGMISDLPPFLRAIVNQGAAGVGLFFVISAFTLISSFHARIRREQHPDRNFFLRRFFRIAPLFYVAMLVYPPLQGLAPSEWVPDGVGLFHFVMTALFLHGLYPTTFNGIVPGGWSVGVEMIFYVCVPFLVRRITSLKRAAIAVLVTMLAGRVIGTLMVQYMKPHWQGKWGFCYEIFYGNNFVVQLPVFLTGFLLFFVLRATAAQDERRSPRQLQKRALLLLLLASAVLLEATFDPIQPRLPGAISYVTARAFPTKMHFALGHALLAWSLALVPWSLIVNRVTRYLGTISYSGYLCHFAIVFHVLRWALRPLLPQLPPTLQLIVYFLLAVALTAVVATLTYRYIEVPGIALGRNLIRRLEARTPAAPVAAGDALLNKGA